MGLLFAVLMFAIRCQLLLHVVTLCSPLSAGPFILRQGLLVCCVRNHLFFFYTTVTEACWKFL